MGFSHRIDGWLGGGYAPAGKHHGQNVDGMVA